MKSLNIFIVEDNAIEEKSLWEALEHMGAAVVGSADNYTDALLQIHKTLPDLVFIDIRLKGDRDGIELARELNATSKTPVVYLTGTNDEATTQKAVTTDPIAYLNKPYSLPGLNSTLMLCTYKLEHTYPIQSEYTSLGYDYYFDQQYERLYYKEHPIKISFKEKKLLMLLLNARGGLVPSEIIEEAIWPESSNVGSNLRTLIYRLHQKLEFKLIEARAGLGYRLNTPPV